MGKMLKQMLALMLVLAMLLPNFATAALAAEEDGISVTAETTESVAEPTDAPEEVTESAVEPTDAPEEVTESAVEPTDAPEEVTEPAVEPTDAPEEVTEPVGEPTEQPTEAPEQETSVPAEETAPADASIPVETFQDTVSQEAALESAVTEPYPSGICGDNLTWSLVNGTLTISGTGAMMDYADYNGAPWFAHRDAVNQIVFDGAITHIGAYAFYYFSITELTIPEGVESIGYRGFYGCTMSSLSLPDSLSVLGREAFGNCGNLTAVTIPSGVKNLTEGAFYTCDNLAEVVISDGVTTIGKDCFKYCVNLRSVEIPNSVVSIGEFSLGGCHALEEVFIPSSVTSIYEDSFCHCTGLREITVDPQNTAYCSIDGVLYSKDMTQMLKYPAAKGGRVTVPETVRILGTGCFEYTNDIPSITIPEGVTEFGKSCFECSRLSEITIPESVTSIGPRCFMQSDITTLIIPEKVKSIGEECFWACYNLKQITFRGDAPVFGNIETGACNLFNDTETTIYYPEGNATWTSDVMQDYGGTITWKSSASLEACGDNLTWSLTDGTLTISGTGAMYDYDRTDAPWTHAGTITKVILEDGVTSIGSFAFYYFPDLTNVTIPEGVISIGESAFAACDGLKEITIPASVSSIGDGAFDRCFGLSAFHVAAGNTAYSSADGVLYNADQSKLVCFPAGKTGSFAIPNTVTTIGKSAFNCVTLDSLTVPASVSIFERSAFQASIITDLYISNLESWLGATFAENAVKKTVRYDSNPLQTAENLYVGGVLTTDIVIPETVTQIPAGAFYRFNNLTGLSLHSGIKEIGEYAFSSCEFLTSVTIPDGAVLGSSAFRNCISLTKVTLPGDLTQISDYLFWGCENLANIALPDSLTVIGSFAFSNCTSLTSIVIPDGAMLGSSAFRNCISLTKVTLPGDLTQISDYLFWGCENLANIALPDSLTVIGSFAFSNCTSLTSIVIPAGVSSVGANTFFNCTGLTGIILPKGLTAIGDYAFSSCTSLTALTIPESVTSIGEEALSYTGLTSLEIPASVASLGSYAIADCTALKNVKFAGNAPIFDEDVFYGVEATVSYPENNATWTEEVRQNHGGTLTWEPYVLSSDTCGDNLTWSLTDGTLTISGTGAMYDYDRIDAPWTYAGTITKVILEDGITTIGNYAFFDFPDLTDITIPEGVVSIGKYAFAYCDGLKEITIPASVSSIDDGVFDRCPGLSAFHVAAGNTVYSTADGILYNADQSKLVCFPAGKTGSFVIPDTVTTIGESAFNSVTLDSLTIPASVATFEGDAFATAEITDVHISNLESWLGATFAENAVKKTIRYDSNPLQAAENLYVGGVLTTDIVIPETVTQIPAGAFYRFNNLTGLSLHSGIKEIGECAFSSCEFLTSVTIPDGAVLGSSAFQNCISLTKVTLPGDLTQISDYLFSGCENLANIALPDSLTVIGTFAFSSCTSLTALTIPEGVTSIGKEALSYTGLTSLEIPASVASLGSYAIADCTALKNVKFAGNAPIFDEEVFYGVEATIGYPANNATWTEEVRQNHGGTLTWEPYVLSSGTCGDNLTWSLTDGTLTISGTGAMYDYDRTDAPWTHAGTITKVILEDGVTSIGSFAFYYLPDLTNVTIPEGVISIGKYAFAYCDGLKEITIPASVSSIGDEVFDRCFGLSAFHVASGNTAYSSADGVLCNADQSKLVCFPAGKTGSFAIPNTVTTIGKSAFNSVTLDSLTVPASVSIFERSAFQASTITDLYISNLESWLGATFAENAVKKIVRYDSNPLQAAENLYVGGVLTTDIVIPKTVTQIPAGAFYSFRNMTGLTLHSGIQKIGEIAFANNTSFVSLEMPEGIVSIEERAFESCGLTRIEIPSSVTSLGILVFSNCSALKDVKFAGNAPDIDESAFNGVAATVRYPADNATWTEEVRQNYGGTLAWIENTVTAVVGKADQEATSENPVDIDMTFDSKTEEERNEVVTDAIQVLSETDNAHISVTVNAGDGNVTISTEAAKSIAAKATGTEPIKLVVENVTATENVSRAAATYEITMKQGEKEVFAEGASSGTVTVSIPAPVSVTAESTFAVYHVAEDGTKTKVENARLENGKIFFTTNHFSVYTVELEEDIQKFQLGGASMTLGNSLTINFAVKETDVTPEEAEQNLYYAKITRSYTDGRSDDVITVDSRDWTDYGTVRGIAYNGIAAKEMADSFQVQIFNRDNVAVSELWSDSVRDYAMRILNKGTNAYQQTLLVDMLNYGAAAQVYFGYSSADLANKNLTETQKGYATKNVNMTNNLVQGNNYFAASLTLESNIKLTIAFQNMNQTKVKDMYAIVTFTDHYGKKQETRIEGENFFVVSASGGRYGVTVENMVVADAYQPITCTVYNADGSIHGSAVDSVESYLARKMDSNALFAPIAKFCTSAYQYFHH